MGLVNLGIVQGKCLLLPEFQAFISFVRGPGQVTLGKLRIKKGALDAFRLPVDVIEGVCRTCRREFADGEEQATWESFPCPYIG
jgi:hypothetical protein